MQRVASESEVPWIRKLSRRLFFKTASGLIFMTKASSSISASFVEKLFVRTVEEDQFKFDAATGQIEWNERRREQYRLVVDGLIKEKRSFSYGDLKAFRQIEQVSDFHCVEGWSVPDIRWGGFRFSEILNRVAPKPQAACVVFHSFGKTSAAPQGQEHYIESVPISELIDPERDILLVLSMNQNSLTEDHGAPLRLIAPYDLGYKSIKFITRIEFAREARPGWWTIANPMYPMEAKVPAGRLRKKN
jgi:DMSO/TMAO reductase YedYZ molybdopterin-dependent catalytic subunit